MRKGKIAAQAAHASMQVFLDKANLTCSTNTGGIAEKAEMTIPIIEVEMEWFSDKFTKICVSVDSENELLNIYQQAKEANLLCCMIEDLGLTEFKGIPTKTAVAIGPDYNDKIDQITGHLKLL